MRYTYAAASAVVGGIALCCSLAAGIQPGAAIAAESASAAGSGAARFAIVERIRGEVTATAGEDGPTRTLRERDAVYVGERIHAVGSSEAVLKTGDAGFIAIRPQAEFVAEQFAAEGESTDQ